MGHKFSPINSKAAHFPESILKILLQFLPINSLIFELQLKGYLVFIFAVTDY